MDAFVLRHATLMDSVMWQRLTQTAAAAAELNVANNPSVPFPIGWQEVLNYAHSKVDKSLVPRERCLL